MRLPTTIVVLWLLLSNAAQAADAPSKVPAFPGAEGAGAFAAGGRGGSVYVVTTLAPSGHGSLADAVSRPNRIVVFAVSGTIDLSGGVPGRRGKIVVDQDHITIAGQSAPGEGICLKHGVLEVRASDVIIRHLRVRRGFIAEGDSGDAVTVKPSPRSGTGDAMADILLDHISASWATDENLTVTHPNRTTAQYCLIAEGLDYHNPRQTPPRHSEGSLWGVSAPNGRSTLHHNLYAHNRLRNPRTTGGDPPFAVLEFSNNVVYNASELFSHTGHEPVHLNWINNYYKAGPSTPESLRGNMFEFEHSRENRMYAAGNVIAGFADRSQDNWKAVRYAKKLTAADEAVIRVSAPFAAPPLVRQSAEEAYETVLAESGATLPARDAVDLRIVRSVCDGTGRVIDKEIDLPPTERWPTYHAIAAPPDSDGDGIPDSWQRQFGLPAGTPSTAAAPARAGYSLIEHYLNNTDPTGGATPIVYVSAAVSRARPDSPGMLRITRTGDTKASLAINYRVSGNAVSGKEHAPLPARVLILAGSSSILIPIAPEPAPNGAGRITVVHLEANASSYHLGCPAAALVTIDQ